MVLDVSKVTRFEVIDDSGRRYVIKWASVSLSLQDEERTLKVFVKGKWNIIPCDGEDG